MTPTSACLHHVSLPMKCASSAFVSVCVVVMGVSSFLVLGCIC